MYALSSQRKFCMMVFSSVAEKNSASRLPVAGGFAYSPVNWCGRQSPPAYFHIPKQVRDGVLAISKSANAGAISEEEANDLIALLLSMWLGTSVAQTIGGYLERDIAQALMDIQAWGERHGDRE